MSETVDLWRRGGGMEASKTPKTPQIHGIEFPISGFTIVKFRENGGNGGASKNSTKCGIANYQFTRVNSECDKTLQKWRRRLQKLQKVWNSLSPPNSLVNWWIHPQ